MQRKNIEDFRLQKEATESLLMMQSGASLPASYGMRNHGISSQMLNASRRSIQHHSSKGQIKYYHKNIEESLRKNKSRQLINNLSSNAGTILKDSNQVSQNNLYGSPAKPESKITSVH